MSVSEGGRFRVPVGRRRHASHRDRRLDKRGRRGHRSASQTRWASSCRKTTTTATPMHRSGGRSSGASGTSRAATTITAGSGTSTASSRCPSRMTGCSRTSTPAPRRRDATSRLATRTSSSRSSVGLGLLDGRDHLVLGPSFLHHSLDEHAKAICVRRCRHGSHCDSFPVVCRAAATPISGQQSPDPRGRQRCRIEWPVPPA